MRIAVDIMGGDNAPDAIMAGCIMARDLLGPDDRLVLVGDACIIRETLAESRLLDDPRYEIFPTTEIIGMGDSPIEAIKAKPDSNIVKWGWLGGRRAGDLHCGIIISAGNTGACVASAQMAMRRLPGVHRPGICVTIPSFFGPVVVSDVGANPEPRPSHLHQYGHMAAIWAEKVLGKEKPKVAVLSIGSEEGKGNTLARGAAEFFKKDPTVNYIGYIEGRDIFNGVADVVITEGFTGNVVLKLAEGLSKGIFETIAHEAFEVDPELAIKLQPVVERIHKKHDYHEYGGAPLLGTNGICIICHGSSKAITIRNAIRNAMGFEKLGINQAIAERLTEASKHVKGLHNDSGEDA